MLTLVHTHARYLARWPRFGQVLVPQERILRLPGIIFDRLLNIWFKDFPRKEPFTATQAVGRVRHSLWLSHMNYISKVAKDCVLAWCPTLTISTSRTAFGRHSVLDFFWQISFSCQGFASKLLTTTVPSLNDNIRSIFHVVDNGLSSIQSTSLSHFCVIVAVDFCPFRSTTFAHIRILRVSGIWGSKWSFTSQAIYEDKWCWGGGGCCA